MTTANHADVEEVRYDLNQLEDIARSVLNLAARGVTQMSVQSPDFTLTLHSSDAATVCTVQSAAMSVSLYITNGAGR